ncbi:MAG: peptide chain release factor 1 [Candidatus Hinthialibacter antarcticus]|nr:peptide chain release factor 1 [Candidatus Hinthialibacter antarcticus]
MKLIEEKLQSLQDEFKNLETRLSDPETSKDRDLMTKLSKRHSELSPVLQDFDRWKKTKAERIELEEAVQSDDEELAEMAQDELPQLREQESELLELLQKHLIPKDPYGDRNAIIEVRAGTGGDEAALFAGDLFRMYCRYAESQGWKYEVLSSNETGLGGFKEVIFNVSGEDVFSRLQFEAGGHRVQRVPETEASGRIHTSAATVAVLPEAEEVDIEVKNEDIRIDVFRSSGPGGQSVNTTDSAVRINHIPTGLVVSCQDEKSQHKNRARALKVLRSRLFEMERSRLAEEQAAQRKSMVGSGDRSGRIRTYNFPQNRVTDHRINLTLHRLEAIMSGELDEMIDALMQEDQLKRMRDMG